MQLLAGRHGDGASSRRPGGKETRLHAAVVTSLRATEVYITCNLFSAQVGSLPALIAAAVAVGYVAGDASLRATVNQTDASLVSPNTYGSAGFVIGIAALAIIMELLFIIVRICNIGLINLKVKIFLIIVSLPLNFNIMLKRARLHLIMIQLAESCCCIMLL